MKKKKRKETKKESMKKGENNQTQAGKNRGIVMPDNVVHEHMIIRAEVNEPITSEQELKNWLNDLVKIIKMKIIKGPYVSYVTKEGNRGITGVVMIETSHISIHIWDETSPALVQCDVYSCADFHRGEVIMHLGMMKPEKIEYMMIDRTKKISCETPHHHRHKTSYMHIRRALET